MELTTNLNISAKEFFTELYNAIINDVLVSANQTITKKDVKSGLSYTKVLKTRSGRHEEATVLIK